MFTPQSFLWLQSLLSERFSTALELRQTERKLTITHRGVSGQVVLDSLEPGFAAAGFDPTFATWDPCSEGWTAPLGKPLPAPALRRSSESLIERIGDNYHVHYDVLGLAYWALNRIEEVEATDLDSHERFKMSSTHASRYGYFERPIVDEWFEVLKQVMAKLWPTLNLERPVFRTWLSHDVDRPSRYGFTTVAQLMRRMAGDVLRRGRLVDVLRAPVIRYYTRSALHADDPWNTFRWLMDVSEKEGIRSTFFFIAGGSDARFDAEYELEHPAIQHLIREIHSRNHDIGLHPSYHAYIDEGAVKEEAKHLIRVCGNNGVELEGWGARMHYLRWRHPRSLEVLASAGAAFDSSMAFEDGCGFRCGTCHDFKAFSPIQDRVLDLRVRPLVAMESSVTSAMGLGVGERAYAKFSELKAACRAVGGVFSVLWHNSNLDSAEAKDLYEQVVKN